MQILALILLATFSAPPRVSMAGKDVICPLDEWLGNVAGDAARDCGTDLSYASEREVRRARRCVARTLRRERTAVVGYWANAVDAGFCGVAVFRPGEAVRVGYFEYDLSFPDDDPRSGPAAWFGTCAHLPLEWRDGYPEPYQTAQCQEDPAAFERYAKRSKMW